MIIIARRRIFISTAMRKYKTKTYLLVTLFLAFLPATAIAQSSSTNYKIEESFFGIGGELDPNSPNYQARQSAGETTVGNTTSSNYQAQAGFNTTDQPMLEFEVSNTDVDLGTLSASSTATATATFHVRTYLSDGYVVTAVGDPPANESGDQIAPLAAPTASSAGTEQFGINLVANTSPATFGADPEQSPDGSFSFGDAASGYDTANVYKYVQGDIIAESASSSGKTIYTVSYIFNIAALTEAGEYTTDQTFVATSTY